MVKAVLASSKVGHKVNMVCDNCGKIFLEYASKRPRPLKFCVQGCSFEYARKTSGYREIETADIETAAPPKPKEPGMDVVYDPIRKELRNV